MSGRQPRLEERLLGALFGRAMKSAGAALWEMSGNLVSIDTPVVQRLPAAEVVELAGGAGSAVVGVYVGLTGGMTGHSLIMLPPVGAHRLASILIDGIPRDETPEDPLAFDEMEISALQELGNVTFGAFMNEVGMHLHEPIFPTVPQAVVEFCGAILDGVLLDLVTGSEELLAARTIFEESGHRIDGTFLILPHEASLDLLLSELGAAA